MPDWLEIIFACLSAFSVACSLFLLWGTKYKNRISRKTLELQEVIFGDAKYSYDEHDYLKHIQVKLILHNSTEKSFLLSSCKIADYSLCKRRIVNDDNTVDDEILGIKILPISSTEICGIISVNYEIDFYTLKPITLTFSNGKQIVYSTVQQITNEPN